MVASIFPAPPSLQLALLETELGGCPGRYAPPEFIC